MKKLELLKAGAEIIVSVGVGAIVGNAVIFTTPLKTKAFQGLAIKAGSFVLSSMASDKATEYVGTKIDAAADAVKGFITIETPKNEAIKEEEAE